MGWDEELGLPVLVEHELLQLRLQPFAERATSARTLSDLQAELAAHPNDEAVIGETRPETARLLGDRNTLPANGAPSDAQVRSADEQIEQLKTKLPSLIAGSAAYMAVIDQIVALTNVSSHEELVEQARQNIFTARDVDKASEGVLLTEGDREQFKAAANSVGLT